LKTDYFVKVEKESNEYKRVAKRFGAEAVRAGTMAQTWNFKIKHP